MGVAPRDTPRTDVAAELDGALAGGEIEIELEFILKANSVSRPRLPICYENCNEARLKI